MRKRVSTWLAIALFATASLQLWPAVARSAPPGETQAQRQARLEGYSRQLAPVYQRRLREDGEASANAWLARRVRELGERDARRAAAQARRRDKGDADADDNREPCAQTVVVQRLVPSLSGGAMEMIMVTECVPGT
jgi:hypothetical protein